MVNMVIRADHFTHILIGLCRLYIADTVDLDITVDKTINKINIFLISQNVLQVLIRNTSAMHL